MYVYYTYNVRNVFQCNKEIVRDRVDNFAIVLAFDLELRQNEQEWCTNDYGTDCTNDYGNDCTNN